MSTQIETEVQLKHRLSIDPLDQLDPLEAASNAADLSYTPDSRESDVEADTPPPTYPPTPTSRRSLDVHRSQSSLGHEVFEAYPEGGYGWVVTASAFALIFHCLGALYTWGVFQAQLQKEELGSSLLMGLIGAMAAWSQAFCCLPAGWLLNRWGPSKTATIGVLGMAASMIGAGFCTKIYGGLLFFQGPMFGITTSLIFMPAYTIPSQFFMKKRGLTTGLASCGGGIGGAIWSIAVQKIIDKWGAGWAYRTIGFSVLLFGLPAAYLLKPGYSPRRNSVTEFQQEKGIFRSSRYIRVLLTAFVASYPFFIPPYYIPQYSQAVGMSPSQGALFSAVFNVSSGVGRIAFGLLADAVLGTITAWSLSLLVISLASILIWPYATSQGLIILFVIICGMGSGGFFSLESGVVASVIGVHRLNRGISWVEVAQSFGYFAGPVSAGALLDLFGGAYGGAGAYKPAMYLVGGTCFFAFAIVATVRYSTDKALLKKV